MTRSEIIHIIDNDAWNSQKMDWLGMERILVAILRLPDSDSEKVQLCKEALNAFTKRGYFRDDDLAI